MEKRKRRRRELAPAADRQALLTEFGARVKGRRHLQAMTLAEVSEASCLSVAYLSLIERGERNPPFTTLVALAAALGTSTRHLCE